MSTGNIAQEKILTTAVEMATTPEVTVTVVKLQGWAKADIKKLSYDGLQIILKDFGDKNQFVRWLGRHQMRREMHALALLESIAGIPSFLGELAPCGILLELMKGEPISQWRGARPEDVESMFRRLGDLVDAIHAQGVAHLDLRKRDNILIATDGTPSIIDFNASIRFTPGGLLARLFFPMFRAVDRAALLKWKAQHCPAAMTGDEMRRLRWMTRLRRLWIFN
jgi:RIO-like serine/threonine protein kinase